MSDKVENITQISKNCLALIVGMKERSKLGTYSGGTALIVVALIVREECIIIIIIINILIFFQGFFRCLFYICMVTKNHILEKI